MTNSAGRSARLFLVDGKSTVLITAEITNWTGHVLLRESPKRSEETANGHTASTAKPAGPLFELTHKKLGAKLVHSGTIQTEREDALAAFAADFAFSSPGAASAVILPRSDNGRMTWKIAGTLKTRPMPRGRISRCRRSVTPGRMGKRANDRVACRCRAAEPLESRYALLT